MGTFAIFPEIFHGNTVTNVGQVLGEPVFVTVSGTLDVSRAPQQLQANIQGGKLCVTSAACVDLPISGTGIFRSVYLGERLRIGQNINGGGALVVQVKVED